VVGFAEPSAARIVSAVSHQSVEFVRLF